MLNHHCRLFRTAGVGLALAGGLGFSAAGVALAQSAGSGDLQASVTAALAQDAALQNQQIQAQVSNRVVTLAGTVQTQKQRQEAETVAANVPGIAGIQDDLQVTDQASTQADVPPPPPSDTQQPEQPATAAPQSFVGQNPPPPPPDQPASAAPATAANPAYQGSGNQGYGNQGYGNQGYGSSYPSSTQASALVTIPAGTLLQVRTSEPLNVTRLQPGAAFQVTAASDIFEGNVLAVPRGALLNGTVVNVKKPGALGGNGELQLQITSISLGGRNYPVATDTWSSKSPNKAGYTATNTVGGALMGAIIGGLIGRGPGAAAGALVGGGAGMLASARTGGPRSILPPETLLNFHISAPVTLQPVSWREAQRLAQNAPRLQRRTVYMAPAYPYPYGYPYPYPAYAYGYPYPYPYRVYGW